MLTKALVGALEGLDHAMLEELYEEYGKTCWLQTGPNKWPQLNGAVFDQHFGGRYVAMSTWLAEVTVFNFADFLDVSSVASLTDVVSEMAAGAKAKSESPTESIG